MNWIRATHPYKNLLLYHQIITWETNFRGCLRQNFTWTFWTEWTLTCLEKCLRKISHLFSRWGNTSLNIVQVYIIICSLEIEIYNNTSNYSLFLSPSQIAQSLEIFPYIKIINHFLCATFSSIYKFSKAILKGRYRSFFF